MTPRTARAIRASNSAAANSLSAFCGFAKEEPAAGFARRQGVRRTQLEARATVVQVYQPRGEPPVISTTDERPADLYDVPKLND
jgi:hypothetical protein